MLSSKVKHAILILGELESIKNDLKGLKSSELKVRLGFPVRIQQLLTVMKFGGLIGLSPYRGWYFMQADLSRLSLMELISIVDPGELERTGWPRLGANYPEAVEFDSRIARYWKAAVSGKMVSDLLPQNRKQD